MKHGLPSHERILSRCARTPYGDLIWTGAVNNHGYGVIKVKRRLQYVHRVVYEAVVGRIPPGCVIDHLCHIPLCVEPTHLEEIGRAS
jgi:hypothetical protein